MNSNARVFNGLGRVRLLANLKSNLLVVRVHDLDPSILTAEDQFSLRKLGCIRTVAQNPLCTARGCFDTSVNDTGLQWFAWRRGKLKEAASPRSVRRPGIRWRLSQR